MKIHMNFKSILVYTLCLTGPLVLASCSENRATDSKEIAEQENINRATPNDTTAVVIENDNDARFLMDAAEMQMEEISLGKLAQQKSNTPHVKELGKMMEEDHTKTLEELKVLAQSKSVAIPTTLTEDSRDALKKLEDKTGNDFDKAYSDMMVDHHEDAVDKFEKAASDAEDPQIKAWASEKLPGMKTHLRHAKDCKEKCDKDNSNS
ncbi:DUF4142 domain-containing protein [Pararhodonellum marinum]|uniref:DUF4142 domain-containing protein n=1 Tax=Pararhodonellum marinum TaxID=2755358 RepID=UPI00188E7065|nr:DUF4142 domain-containing protein [Pararhodonellum marinum]